ncbi:hypothetical protein KRMM14A1004_23100 [Krasilnikovia sp. MM14-A1004]
MVTVLVIVVCSPGFSDAVYVAGVTPSAARAGVAGASTVATAAPAARAQRGTDRTVDTVVLSGDAKHRPTGTKAQWVRAVGAVMWGSVRMGDCVSGAEPDCVQPDRA